MNDEITYIHSHTKVIVLFDFRLSASSMIRIDLLTMGRWLVGSHLGSFILPTRNNRSCMLDEGLVQQLSDIPIEFPKYKKN